MVTHSQGGEDLPGELVEGLNVGLSSGDWDQVLDLFADRGSLVVDRGSRTSFEGPEGIRDALEGLRMELGGVRYAHGPGHAEGESGVVADLLASSGPDAPEGRLHLDLGPDDRVREAVLELDPPHEGDEGPEA